VQEKLDKSHLSIELLKPEHRDIVKQFECGRKDEDDFLHNDALPSQNARLSETYLLIDDERNKIVSYITIAVGSFQLAEDRKLGNVRLSDKPYRVYSNHMPCMLIGKLATDGSETGRGGATYLIDFAVIKAIEANLPIPFIALHAYHELVGFYKRLGFFVAFTSSKKGNTTAMYMEIPCKVKE